MSQVLVTPREPEQTELSRVVQVLRRPGRPVLSFSEICKELLSLSAEDVKGYLDRLLVEELIERSYTSGYEIGFRARSQPRSVDQSYPRVWTE